MNELVPYLSDAQLRDFQANKAFNVTTPAENTWRVLLRDISLVNLIDPKNTGRCLYVRDSYVYQADQTTREVVNAVSMLFLLRSPEAPRTLIQQRLALMDKNTMTQWRMKQRLLAVTTGEEFAELLACSDAPPQSYRWPTDPDVLAFYQ